MASKEEFREWYFRGLRDGRKQVVEGIMNALGLDYHQFDIAPVEEIENGKMFEGLHTCQEIWKRKKGEDRG